MKIKSFNYNWDGHDNTNPYRIDNVDFVNLNLVVGRNATGKSRLVQSIYSLAKMISKEVSNLFEGQFSVSLNSDKQDELEYEIHIFKGQVVKELIKSKGFVFVERTGDYTRIYSEIKKDYISINPPSNKLILHVRRDIEEFPFLESIVNWAENCFGFKFGNITPNSFLIDKKTDKLTSIDEIPSILEKLISYNKDYGKTLESIITDFNSLGYNITNIEVSSELNKDLLFVKEEGIMYRIPQHSLSQGMFRSLVLIIFLEYVFVTKQATTILIDDLCEGLDYERAVKLGKLIFEKYGEKNIQIITTSNDSFLMDAVDLKFWNILMRDGGVVHSKNSRKDKKLFDDFIFTGLSNFDLLSSDYLIEK